MRLRRQIYDYIVGMGSAQKLDIRVDGKRVARFIVGGEAPGVAGPLTWVGEIVGETAWELYMHDADDGLEIRVPVKAGTRTVAVSFVDSPWEPEGFPQPVMEERDFGRIFDEQYDGYAAVDTVAIGECSSAARRASRTRRRAPERSCQRLPAARTAGRQPTAKSGP